MVTAAQSAKKWLGMTTLLLKNPIELLAGMKSDSQIPEQRKSMPLNVVVPLP